MATTPVFDPVVVVSSGTPKRLVLAETDVRKDDADVCELGFTDDMGDGKRQRRTETTHKKGGSLSGAAPLAEDILKRYATVAVTRRRRIAAPVRPKPAISMAQPAGSGTAGNVRGAKL